MCRQRRQVVGVVIHIMTIPGLSGAPMATPVMGNDAIAVTEKEQHLCVPVISRQRPPVTEHDWLACAPILVEDLNAVLGGDRVHIEPPLPRITRVKSVEAH